MIFDRRALAEFFDKLYKSGIAQQLIKFPPPRLGQKPQQQPQQQQAGPAPQPQQQPAPAQPQAQQPTQPTNRIMQRSGPPPHAGDPRLRQFVSQLFSQLTARAEAFR